MIAAACPHEWSLNKGPHPIEGTAPGRKEGGTAAKHHQAALGPNPTNQYEVADAEVEWSWANLRTTQEAVGPAARTRQFAEITWGLVAAHERKEQQRAWGDNAFPIRVGRARNNSPAFLMDRT
jgi:hypothetical protein